MKAWSGENGISLVEVMISMATTICILGALFTSSLSMQNMMHASERYSGSYADQRRLIDYLGRDLRRALAVNATDAKGTRSPLGTEPLSLGGRATLILTMPGFYASNAPLDAHYDQPLVPVADGWELAYGTTAGPSATVEVRFRKVFFAAANRICFVREEGDQTTVIVRDADSLYAQVAVAADRRSGTVKTWFRAAFSGQGPLVTTSDAFLLRNPQGGPLP